MFIILCCPTNSDIVMKLNGGDFPAPVRNDWGGFHELYLVVEHGKENRYATHEEVWKLAQAGTVTKTRRQFYFG